MAHVVISAAHKSSGKTTIALGLCAAIRNRGLAVQAFKKGPDYIDPLWLGRASGRPCFNLDYQTMSRSEIDALFGQRIAGADIGIIEGNKGLYDGLDLDGSNSNAALAKQLQAPVVLVLDARGMTRGIAPLVLGYQDFDPKVRIAGIILNRVGGSRHESKLRAILEHYTDVLVLGAVHQDRRAGIEERHLGLIPSNEMASAEQEIDHWARAVADQVDLDRLMRLAAEAGPVARIHVALEEPRAARVRIAVARDAAFGFYYPDDLEALECAGARLVSFDTLSDAQLPEVDGLFIGGGFPETHMRALEANASLRADLRAKIQAGLPAYAECGGLMYLARRMHWRGEAADMVGVIPGDVHMRPRPVGRGYVTLRATGQSPWPQPREVDAQASIHAHEFHYSSLSLDAPDSHAYAYEVRRGTGIDGQRDGLVIHRLLASYVHMRHTRAHPWAAQFVDFVASCKQDHARPSETPGAAQFSD